MDDAAGVQEVEAAGCVQRDAAAGGPPKQRRPPRWAAQQLTQVAARAIPAARQGHPHTAAGGMPSQSAGSWLAAIMPHVTGGMTVFSKSPQSLGPLHCRTQRHQRLGWNGDAVCEEQATDNSLQHLQLDKCTSLQLMLYIVWEVRGALHDKHGVRGMLQRRAVELHHVGIERHALQQRRLLPEPLQCGRLLRRG